MEGKYPDAAANVDSALNSGATVLFELDGTKCVAVAPSWLSVFARLLV